MQMSDWSVGWPILACGGEMDGQNDIEERHKQRRTQHMHQRCSPVSSKHCPPVLFICEDDYEACVKYLLYAVSVICSAMLTSSSH